MAITRKPKLQENGTDAPAVDVDALIHKGGSVASAAAPAGESAAGQQARSTVAATLRIPAQLAEKIDRLLEQRPLRVPRHQWILEAMVEKLEREAAKGQVP